MSLESGEGQDRRAIAPDGRLVSGDIRKVGTYIELGSGACGGTQYAMICGHMRELRLAGIGHLHPLDARTDADLGPSRAVV